MKRILVLGYFGYNTNQLDGQTVKTRDIYRLVEEQAGGKVDYYDTEDFQFHKMSIFRMFWKVMRCRTLFYLPAHNNLKHVFPFIYLMSVLCRFEVHYFVVGGWLREFLTDLPFHRFGLKRIAGIHVETQRLLTELQQYYGFNNVDIFPNFRFFDFDLKKYDSDKLRIVFMARVCRMKGLDWIFELASRIKECHLQDRFSVTFFGPVLSEDQVYFEESLSEYSFVEYKGALEPSEIHKTLCQYDVMLLPTHYYTEGLPGSIVDAYIAGLPVIVSEWKHAHEFVDDGISGYIIPFREGQNQLIEKVMLLEKDRRLLHELKANVLKKRMEFAPPSLNSILPRGAKLNICFISRVERSKGLDTIKEIASILYREGLANRVGIDFYGPKTDDYFDSQCIGLDICEYKGILQPSEVIPTLQKYDALLFPTHYDGEGCPGILVEALCSSIPIIASNWKYNVEFVQNGVNGFLCDTYNAEEYVHAICRFFDSQLKNQMARQSYYRSECYSDGYARVLLLEMNHGIV